MAFVIFEAIEILIPFAADIAPIGLVLLHAEGSWVRAESVGIDNGECAVFVCGELLSVVTVLDPLLAKVIYRCR